MQLSNDVHSYVLINAPFCTLGARSGCRTFASLSHVKVKTYEKGDPDKKREKGDPQASRLWSRYPYIKYVKHVSGSQKDFKLGSSATLHLDPIDL
jgi:hypothetical protein